MLLISFLLVGSLAMMIGRMFVPWEDVPDKATINMSIPLGFRERIRLQRINIYAIGFLLLLGAYGHWLSTLQLVLMILLITAILCLPVRYTLTDEGITLGRTALRRWNEFRDVEVKRGRLHLIGADQWRDMDVLLPVNDDALLALPSIQRGLKGAPSRAHRAPQRGAIAHR